MKLYSVDRSPPCRTVILLGTYLNANFEIIETSPKKGETATPKYKKMNPQHVVPTLVDNGYVLWESRAIAKYLVRKYSADNDSLYPEEFSKRIELDKILDFDLGTLFRRTTDYFVPLLTTGKYDESRKPKLEDALQVLDTFLDNNKSGWIIGDNMTIADVSILTSVDSLEITGYDLSKYNNIVKWLSRVKSAIPSYETVGKQGALGFKEMVDSYIK